MLTREDIFNFLADIVKEVTHHECIFRNVISARALSTILEHIQISFIALLIACLIGVPLGILLTKTKHVSEFVINIAAVLQTIPSLALLGLMIPILELELYRLLLL